MPFVENNGANLYYELKGNTDSGKYPVVLLHGNGESMEIFDKTVSSLKDRFCFLAMDFRGHGKSEITDDNYDFTYEMFADDVMAVTKAAGINQFDIVGFSDGAIVALLLASGRDTAAHIMRMICVGANINPGGIKTFAKMSISNDKRIADFKKDRLTSALCNMMLTQPDISITKLGSIYAHTVIVAGSRDLIRTEHTKQIADAIIHSKLMIIDGADHFIPQKMPHYLTMIINDELG